MTDATEKIFLKTRANLYKYNLDSPEYNTAKETMRNLADTGYIPAISYVIGEYKDMGVDPDIYLSILQDLNDDSGEYYAQLARIYWRFERLNDASIAAEKSLERGCLDAIHYCKDWNRMCELLEGHNPEEYSIGQVTALASWWIDYNDLPNKWMDYSLDYIERDLTKGELHISNVYILRETRCESYRTRLKHIYESIFELAKEQNLDCDDYVRLYYIACKSDDVESQHRWGMKSLELGNSIYLSNIRMIRRLIDNNGDVIDHNLFEELVSASSEIIVYDAIAGKLDLDVNIRMKYAEKCIALGSEKAKLTLADFKLNYTKYPDYKSVLESILSTKVDDRYLVKMKYRLILECYEALNGDDPNDPIALGLYRKVYGSKSPIRSKDEEIVFKIVNILQGELIKNE